MASIRERKWKNGTTVYTVLWNDPETKKTQDSMSFPDKGEAERIRRYLESNGNRMRLVERILEKSGKGGPTVKDALIKHRSLLTGAGPDQMHRYERAIENHFSGAFGKIPVAAVDEEDITGWIKYMQGKGLSAKTIANHHGFLSAALERAVRLRLCEANPCKGIDLPKDTSVREKMHFLTAAQAKELADAHPKQYVPLVHFLIATGMRWGEATALVGTDFELDPPPGTNPEKWSATVRVTRAWKRDEDNRFYIGQPKTKKAVRTVSLPPRLVERIRPLVEDALLRSHTPNGWVFTTTYGGPVRHSTFHEFWTETLDALGYAKDLRPRIHDLRHTHASLMLAGGMEPFELSRRLGHESIQTTTDRYSHLVPDAHFRGANIAQRALED